MEAQGDVAWRGVNSFIMLLLLCVFAGYSLLKVIFAVVFMKTTYLILQIPHT
jgi:hypothetical protein